MAEQHSPICHGNVGSRVSVEGPEGTEVVFQETRRELPISKRGKLLGSTRHEGVKVSAMTRWNGLGEPIWHVGHNVGGKCGRSPDGAGRNLELSRRQR